MDSNQIGEALQDSLESLKSYLDNQVKYNKLILTQKLGDITSYFALLFIVTALAGGLLLFLSLAFAYWFANITNLDVYIGYLIIALFYGLTIVFIINYREKLIFNPIRNLLGSILFEDEVNNDEARIFNSKEDLKKKMAEVHELIHHEQETLKVKFRELGESLTFANISQQIFRSAYDAVVTSSNIAKIAVLFLKRLKRKTKDKDMPEQKKHLK